MSRFRRVLRLAVLISVGMTLSVYIAVAALYRSNWPHRFVVGVTERELSKAFQRPVHIRSMTGNLINSAIFHDVVLMDTVNTQNYLFKIRHVQATYALLDLIAHSRDIMPAIQTLILEDIDLQFVHDADNRWNFFEFIAPPLDPKKPAPPPLTFRGKIIVRNLHGDYWDYHGFGERPPPAPFHAPIDTATGVIDFANPERMAIQLSGQIDHGTDAVFGGFANMLKGGYQFRFEVKPMALGRWGEYVFPFDGYHIPTGNLFVSGMITALPHPPPGGLPFTPQLKLTVQDAHFQMPMFPPAFEEVNARLRVDQDQAWVEWAGAKANGIPLSINGKIQFHAATIQMAVQTEAFDLVSLKALFPSTAEWKYSGPAVAQLMVSGALTDPLVEGSVQSEAQVYAFPVSQNTTHFTYQHHHLNYALLTGMLYGGQLRGQGDIDFNASSPKLRAALDLSGGEIDRVFPAVSEYLGGGFGAQVSLNGTLRDFSGHVSLQSSDMVAFQQSISRLNIPFRVLNTSDIAIANGQMQLNGSNSPLAFDGQISDLYALNFSFSGTDVGLKDVGNPRGSHRGTLPQLSGQVSGVLDALFWSQPLQAIQASLDMTISDWNLYDYWVASGSATFRWDKGDVDLQKVELQNPIESFSAIGNIKQGVPQQLEIRAQNLHVSTGSIVQSWMIPSLQDATGIVSLQAAVRHRAGADSPNLPLISRMDVDGVITVESGRALGQPFDRWTAEGAWNRAGFTINRTQVEVGTTNVHLKGRISEAGKLALDILPGSYLRLSDLTPSTRKWGQVLGEGTIWGSVGGT
ncbi:MAG: hypothetical protein AAB066_05355, partial [Candidatus Margulisiibacteriota bacterium]